MNRVKLRHLVNILFCKFLTDKSSLCWVCTTTFMTFSNSHLLTIVKLLLICDLVTFSKKKCFIICMCYATMLSCELCLWIVEHKSYAFSEEVQYERHPSLCSTHCKFLQHTIQQCKKLATSNGKDKMAPKHLSKIWNFRHNQQLTDMNTHYQWRKMKKQLFRNVNMHNKIIQHKNGILELKKKEY